MNFEQTMKLVEKLIELDSDLGDELKKKVIIKECERRYPKGTWFKNIVIGTKAQSDGVFKIDVYKSEWCCCTANHAVYINGSFADIIRWTANEKSVNRVLINGMEASDLSDITFFNSEEEANAYHMSLKYEKELKELKQKYNKL